MSNYALKDMMPVSLLDVSEGSNNSKLWRLFSDGMDELDTVFESLRELHDAMKMSGVILDMIGRIVRQKRMGQDDAGYRLYLILAIYRTLSDGSIERINDIGRMILETDFVEVRNLYVSQQSVEPWASDTSYELWLDGSWYLDGTYYLSGYAFQPAFFEVLVKAIGDATLKAYFAFVLSHIKGAGIGYRIREV